MLSVTSAFLSAVLLASTVLAAPSPVRLARRREENPHPLNQRLERPIDGLCEETTYSSNWAGAIWDMVNGTFTSVTGTFTVPQPSGVNGSGASVWVGIDGDTCQNAILQTGIDFMLSDGQVSYGAWYEWYPAAAYDFHGFNISAGDVMRLTVTAFNPTSGNATIENLTSGQTVSKILSSSSALCGQNAEWIVEDFEDIRGLVPFANFSSVTFTNAVATGNGTYTPYGATVVNIEQNVGVLTSVSITETALSIEYV